MYDFNGGACMRLNEGIKNVPHPNGDQVGSWEGGGVYFRSRMHWGEKKRGERKVRKWERTIKIAWLGRPEIKNQKQACGEESSR